MKNILAILIAGILISAAAVAGCSKTDSTDNNTSDVSQQTTQPPKKEKTTSDSKYVVSKKTDSLLTKSQKKSFEKALEGYQGITFEPVAVISQQVVAGVNFVYLCLGTTTTEKPVTTWNIVTVYEDLNENDNILYANSIDLENIKTLSEKEDDTGVAGAFKDVETDSSGKIDETLQKAVNEALKNTKKEYTLITVLGSQTTDDTTNYKIFAQQEKKNGSVDNCILTFSVGSDGKAKLEKSELFDTTAYIGDEDADPDGSEMIDYYE